MEVRLRKIFAGRTMAIATMHKKEMVIAPPLEALLGVVSKVPHGINTDLFGTFTREIPRKDNPIETLRHKCNWAMDQTEADLGIASEGSFGPHPLYYFVQADEEYVMLIDRKIGLEIVARELSTSTNFGFKDIENWESLESFANVSGFPEHGLILRAESQLDNRMAKGIRDWSALKMIFEKMKSDFPGVVLTVETDMRAMHNPTRMKVIENATMKLLQYLQSFCPVCDMPGFVVTDYEEGLPCHLCNRPTRSILRTISKCKICFHEKFDIHPKGKKTEDPMYCYHCNP